MIPIAAKGSYVSKLVICILVAIAVVNSYASVFYYRLSLFPPLALNTTIYEYLQLFFIISGVCFVIGYPLYWHFKEKKQEIITEKRYTWFIALIRYWLAYEISTYGFSKIFHNQFGQSFVAGDRIVSHLSGYALTWNYFGYSYALSCAIAAVQIVGSIMLLFRRTTLAAVILLLPVMINIVLIDVFYGIPAGATRNAFFFTAALLYLLLLHWSVIKTVIFKPVLQPVNYSVYVKQIVRALVIFSSLAYVIIIAQFINVKQEIAGKWEVIQTIKNSHILPAAAWLTDSTNWKNIYIEHARGIVCSPNPYVIEEKRAQRGEYILNTNKDSIKLLLYHRTAPIAAYIKYVDSNTMEWQFKDGADHFELLMTRSAPPRSGL